MRPSVSNVVEAFSCIYDLEQTTSTPLQDFVLGTKVKFSQNCWPMDVLGVTDNTLCGER